MKALPLLIALASLALAGCGTMDVDVTSWERSSLLSNANVRLPNVRLSAQLLSHNDQLVAFGMTNQIASEKIFRAVFAGNEDAPASLDLVNASLSKNGVNLTDRMVVTYRIETVLRTPDGQRHTLTATAESKKLSVDGAMREAIEKATLDLARQCQEKLRA